MRRLTEYLIQTADGPAYPREIWKECATLLWAAK